jgi:hypothetical protein
LRKKWEIDGDDIVDRVARDNPEKILEVMARVLPKELAVTVEQRTPGNLDPDAYAALRAGYSTSSNLAVPSANRSRCSR